MEFYLSERIRPHIARLATSRQYLFDVFDKVGNRWNTQVYFDGACWNVYDVAIHLSVADKGHNDMLFGIAAGTEVIPVDYDLEAFNRYTVQKRRHMSVSEIYASLRTTRAQLLEWLPQVDDEMLDRCGRHATLRTMRVDQLLVLVAWHERSHAADVARVLGIDL